MIGANRNRTDYNIPIYAVRYSTLTSVFAEYKLPYKLLDALTILTTITQSVTDSVMDKGFNPANCYKSIVAEVKKVCANSSSGEQLNKLTSYVIVSHVKGYLDHYRLQTAVASVVMNLDLPTLYIVNPCKVDERERWIAIPLTGITKLVTLTYLHDEPVYHVNELTKEQAGKMLTSIHTWYATASNDKQLKLAIKMSIELIDKFGVVAEVKIPFNDLAVA